MEPPANARLSTQEQLAALLQRIRLGERVGIKVARRLFGVIFSAAFVILAVGGMITTPSWRMGLAVLIVAVFFVISVLVWWPQRSGARLVLARAGVAIPGYGEFTWSQIDALGLRVMTDRGRINLYLEWRIPTLPERVARLDAVMRFINWLKFPARERLIVATRLGLRRPEADLLFQLCDTLWKEWPR